MRFGTRKIEDACVCVKWQMEGDCGGWLMDGTLMKENVVGM